MCFKIVFKSTLFFELIVNDVMYKLLLTYMNLDFVYIGNRINAKPVVNLTLISPFVWQVVRFVAIITLHLFHKKLYE